jgi:hypothetical protein
LLRLRQDIASKKPCQSPAIRCSRRHDRQGSILNRPDTLMNLYYVCHEGIARTQGLAPNALPTQQVGSASGVKGKEALAGASGIGSALGPEAHFSLRPLLSADNLRRIADEEVPKS